MQMGPKEIAVEYRTAANKMKQIVILAELNQCAERRIAEILDAEGEELPKKWQVQLQKPARRSRKFPDGEATPEDDAPAPVSPADRATDRDLFKAVATLLPDAAPVGADSIRPEPEELAEVPVAPGNEDEGYTPADGVGPVATPSVTAAGGGDSEAGNVARSPRVGISLKEGVKRATDRDLFEAVATLLPEAAPVGADSIRPEPEEPAEVPVAPGNEDEGYTPADDVGPVATPSVIAAGGGDSSLKEGAKPGGIAAEDLLRVACRLLGSALALSPDTPTAAACWISCTP